MTYSWSVDGMGDRDDIVLARDRCWENREEKKLIDAEEVRAENRLNGTPIIDLVRKMILENCNYLCISTEEWQWGEFESIHEVIDHLSIEMGFDPDCYSPMISYSDWDTDIYLSI